VRACSLIPDSRSSYSKTVEVKISRAVTKGDAQADIEELWNAVKAILGEDDYWCRKRKLKRSEN